MNANWSRWITIAAYKTFQTVADANDLHMFIEGQERETQDHSQYFEVRTDGPQIKEISRNYFTLDFEINVLFSVHMSTLTMYAPQQLAGLLEQAMTDICVYRHGDEIDDDGTFLGTLLLVIDKRNAVRTNQFGKIRPDTDLVQGTVEGTFKMYLKT